MALYEDYCGLNRRLAPFLLRTDAETVKTVGVIRALADRAMTLGEMGTPRTFCGGNPDFSAHTYPGADTCLAWAREYLDALEKGGWPFAGEFTEPGMNIVDHSFIEKDGRLHVFYNRLPTGYAWWDRGVLTLGHAVTDDLVHWEILPPALTTGPGACEDYQVWSPAVIRWGGRYLMYYTGCNRAVAQSGCLAQSEDLEHWRKYPGNPVLTPGPWYSSYSAGHWSNCRDSMVYAEDGLLYHYYCTSRDLPQGGTGDAVGVAVSRDGIRWEDRGCLPIANCTAQPESPFVFKRDGRYYMLYTSCGGDGPFIAWLTSGDPVHGWTANGRVLLARGENASMCASEAFEFHGRTYLSYIRWHHLEMNSTLGFYELQFAGDGTPRLGARLSQPAL